MLGLTPDGNVPQDHRLRRTKPLADSVPGASRRCSTTSTRLAGGPRSCLSTRLSQVSRWPSTPSARSASAASSRATACCSSGCRPTTAGRAPHAGSKTSRSIRPLSRRIASGCCMPMRRACSQRRVRASSRRAVCAWPNRLREERGHPGRVTPPKRTSTRRFSILSSLVGLTRPYCELFSGRSRCKRHPRIP